MKLTHNSNYTVFVRSQPNEESDKVAHFYDGIYFVQLNQLVTIHFIPWIEDFAQDDFLLPSNLDDPSSSNEARLCLSGYADYIVTYHNEQAGNIKEMTVSFAKSNKPHRCVFYFISPEAFYSYSHELKQMAEQMLTIHSYRRYDEVKNLQVIKYIERSVLGSLFVKHHHFQVLQRPFESLMRLCVTALKQHNMEHSPNIYHGYFGQHSFLANCVWGNDEYECALVCRRHRLPDKTNLSTAGQGRAFWSIQKSVKTDTYFHNHLIYGVYLWLDKDDNSLLQLKLFKIWREFDDWWDFEISSNLVQNSDNTNYRERLTFDIDKIEPQTMVARIMRYASGTNTTF